MLAFTLSRAHRAAPISSPDVLVHLCQFGHVGRREREIQRVSVLEHAALSHRPDQPLSSVQSTTAVGSCHSQWQPAVVNPLADGARQPAVHRHAGGRTGRTDFGIVTNPDWIDQRMHTWARPLTLEPAASDTPGGKEILATTG